MQTCNCDLCPSKCHLSPGQTGRCGVRRNASGVVESMAYGEVTSMLVGPILEKPLAQFFPGMRVLSIGGSGCNMRCKFCQNHKISHAYCAQKRWEPADIVDLAKQCAAGGIAFTYSEPLVWGEYVCDVSALARPAGLKIILKTNAYAEAEAFACLCRVVDAVNIDVKGPPRFYREACGVPAYDTVMCNLAKAKALCHLEASLLVSPWLCHEAERVLRDVAEAGGRDMPLHLIRLIPHFKMTGFPPVAEMTMEVLRNMAEKYFEHVYRGWA